MNNQFNFLDRPVLSTLRDAANLLHSLDRVGLLCRNAETGKLEHKQVNDKENKALLDIDITKTVSDDIEIFRKKLKGAQWYSIDELPFYALNEPLEELEIFHEILKSVLCIGFPNNYDKAYDVFIFYFRTDASEFGPIRSDNVLETSQKMVIERLLSSSLKAILNSHQENRRAMFDFNEQLRGLLDERQNKIEEQKKQVEHLCNTMDSVLSTVLNKYKRDGEIIILKKEAKELLRPHLGNLTLLHKSISNAVNFARTLNFGNPAKEIKLLPDYFSDTELIVKEENADIALQADAYSVDTKIYRFLEELEHAADQLLKDGQKLTSINVGHTLSQPITAAAISDKLKNHSRKVNLLLQQYPQQWKIIRYRFRPIVNVQERANQDKVA